MFKKYIGIISKVFEIEAFKRAYFWLTLIIGIFLLGLGKIDMFSICKDWRDLFSTLGTILLTSGIFTSLVKTIQYLDVIKDELAKIIYDVDYLKTRNDLDAYWAMVNNAMFGEKFSEISEAIQKDIKKVYLPNNLERYYKDYHFDITISRNATDHSFIEVVQIVTVDVITNDPNEVKEFKYTNTLKKDDNNPNDLTSFEILYWNVNDASQQIVRSPESTSDVHIYKVSLSGERKYSLERKSKSVYSIEVDPFKSYIEKNYIIDGMTI